MAVQDLRIYPFIKNEIDSLEKMAIGSGLDSLNVKDVLDWWVVNRDFTIIALFSKPPRYIQGVKKYAEYYSDYDDLTGTFPANTLIVKKTFTDIVQPKMWSLFIQALPGANQITINNDRTAQIEINDVHTFIDGATGNTAKGQGTVTAVSTDGSVTTITYDAIPENIALNDICYFPKGQRLGGIEIKFEWYDNTGASVLKKTEKKHFSLAASGEYERKRRDRVVIHMVASSLGTDVEEVVAELEAHYESDIEHYIKIADWQTWTASIDADVGGASGPLIQAYLAIQIPFTDLEGVTTIKTIANWMKDEMYKGYV